ncbi:MAG: hypothetical protein JEZ05_01085 [Tenericutes bacterium]|nr:hypothetical protein [Mycoplasmatota bacterium]
MIIQEIVLLLLIFIAISGILIFRKKFTFLSVSITVLCISLGVGLILLINVMSQSEYSDWFRDLEIQNIALDDDIAIESIDGIKVIYNNTTDEELTYKSFTFDQFQPVFLSKVEKFYVIVFSQDTSKAYEDGRFYQGDYERFRQIDFLAFIDTENGYIHSLREVELFSRSIDLYSFMANDTSLVYKLYHHYSEKTFAYGFISFFYTENASSQLSFIPTLDVGAFFYPMTDVQNVEGAIHDNVTKVVFGEDDIMLFTTDDGVICLEINIEVSYREDGLISGYSYGSEELTYLDNQIYLHQGYYTEVGNSIYYINNNMDLRKLGSNQVTIPITDLEHWNDMIPE